CVDALHSYAAARSHNRATIGISSPSARPMTESGILRRVSDNVRLARVSRVLVSASRRNRLSSRYDFPFVHCFEKSSRSRGRVRYPEAHSRESLRAFFERGGLAAQVRENFSGEMQ